MGVIYYTGTHTHINMYILSHIHTPSHIHSRWSLTSLAVRILMPALTQMKDDASGARLVLHCAPSLCDILSKHCTLNHVTLYPPYFANRKDSV